MNEDSMHPCSYFQVANNKIKYTRVGYDYFKGLFALANIQIKDIDTVMDHQQALDRSEPFELEYAAQFGRSEQSDLFFRWFSSVFHGDYEEAERLDKIRKRAEELKVVK